MAKLLVVDDEPAVVELMRFILERSGHVVAHAGNGQEALTVLGIDPVVPDMELPDLILLDVMMPVMDGFTAAGFLRENPRTAEIPLLVVTAKGDMRHLFEAMPQVAGYFRKPFDPKLLRETIARLVPKA